MRMNTNSKHQIYYWLICDDFKFAFGTNVMSHRPMTWTAKVNAHRVQLVINVHHIQPVINAHRVQLVVLCDMFGSSFARPLHLLHCSTCADSLFVIYLFICNCKKTVLHSYLLLVSNLVPHR